MVNLIFFDEESKFIEFKRQYTNTFLKTVSAYANYHDGKIYFGIDDTGRIIGIEDVSQICLNIENSINDNVTPRPYYEIKIKTYEDKRIIVLKVYKGSYTPYYYKNKAYKRYNTATVEVDRMELNRLILEGQNDSFENMESKDQDLKFEYMERKFRISKMINNLNKDMLRSLELFTYKKYNNAAALLSDNNPVKNATLILIKFSQSMNIKDKVILSHVSIIEQFDKCIDFYHKHISIGEKIEGPYRETIEEIPLIAYREAVANAITHRDYMAQGDIKIELFDDRIEIVSPGGLPSGISEEEYIEGRLSVMRNAIIADIFLRLKIIEKLATGIRRIKEQYMDCRIQPVFDIKDNSIKVILPKVDKNTDISIKEDRAAYYILDDDEKKIVNYIKDEGEITRKIAEIIVKKGKTQTVKILNSLMEKDLILLIGKGKNTKYIIKY